jgi:hypothetical protein
MAVKPEYAHILASGGFSGEVYDVAAGPIGNADIIDVLLSLGDGALSQDAPQVLISTGNLNAGGVAIAAIVAGVINVNTGWRATAVGALGNGKTITIIDSGIGGLALISDNGTAVTIDLGGTTPNAATVNALPGFVTLIMTGAGTLTLPEGPLTTANGGNRNLDLSGMEVELAGDGGININGRMIYLSIRNTDILTNSITLIPSVSISGQPTYVIDTEGDYILVHETGGVWRINPLPRPAENVAVMKRVDFVQADWVANKITCIQTGVAGAGQVGPHLITVASSYVVQIVNTSLAPDEQVGLQVQYAANGDITIAKAAKAPLFNGTILIVGTLD